MATNAQIVNGVGAQNRITPANFNIPGNLGSMLRYKNFTDINNNNNYNMLVQDSLLPEESTDYYTTIGVQEYKRISIMEVAKGNSFATFKFPLPTRLNDTNHVNWQQENLGMVGGLAQVNTKANEAISKAAENGMQGLAGSALIGTLGGMISSNLGTVGKLGQATAGLAPNEFLTLLFKGPTYKKFTLEFIISPNRPEISQKIHNTLNLFKNSQAPALAYEGTVFKYPRVFNINFVGSEYLYKFKPAVLDTFSVDYAPTEPHGFYKGTHAPESYRISMQFTEIEFWLQGQFE